MDEKQKNELAVDAGRVAGNGLAAGMTRHTHYEIECVRDGKTIWTEEFDNLVVSEGLKDSLTQHFKGSAYTAAWYVGLTSGTPTFAAGDTMASHAGWTEVVAYDNISVRATLTLGTPTTATPSSVDNSASKASFTMSGTVTVGGAFIVTNNTRGGSTGTLYGGGAFSQDRSLIDNDVLNVTITLTAGV